MSNEEFDNLNIGDIVEYSIFKNIRYISCNENIVTLKDAVGDEKRVYKDLFVKYGKIAID